MGLRQPSSIGDDALLAYSAPASRLQEQRQCALELLERYIPLIEKRLQQLDERAKGFAKGQSITRLTIEEQSELSRLQGIFNQGPVDEYQGALDDIRSSIASQPRIDAAFVHTMASLGQLCGLQSAMSALLSVA